MDHGGFWHGHQAGIQGTKGQKDEQTVTEQYIPERKEVGHTGLRSTKNTGLLTFVRGREIILFIVVAQVWLGRQQGP